MYRLIIALSFLLICLPKTSCAQCEDEVCQLILRNIKLVKKYQADKVKLNEQLEDQKLEISNLKEDLAAARYNPNPSELLQADIIQELQNDLTDKDQELKGLTARYNALQRRQLVLIEKIKQLEKDNQSLIQKNKDLKREIEKLYQELGIKSEIIEENVEDGLKISYLQSYFSNYKMGYVKNGVVFFVEKVKDGELIPFRSGIKNKLNVLRVEAAQYIEPISDSPYNDNEIEGRVLVYSDGQLKANVEQKLVRKNELFLKGFRQYELKVDDMILDKPFKGGGQIKMAFIDEATFQKADKSKLNNFVEADDENYFLINSDKPDPLKYYTNKKGLSLSKKDIVVVNSKQINVELFDYKIPDGDVVNVYLNEELIAEELQLPANDQPFHIKNLSLERGHNTLRFEILSEGEQEGCTIAYKIVSPKSKAVFKGDKIYGLIGKKSPAILVVNK